MTIGSPWAPYGLRNDPYFQQALQPRTGDEAARPASLHVGRVHERTLLANQIVGSTSSRAIIQGDAGVGKTSFVSWLKTALAEHEVLTHEAPVRVQAGMGPREFLGEVLKVLLQIRATQAAARAAEAPRSDRSRRTAVPERPEESAFWMRLRRLVDGEDSLAGGATLATFGMQHERIRIPAELQASLFTELEQALAYLSGGGARRVLIHVNNMEGLQGPEARAAADLMQQVRDAFLFEHGHWLFVGTTGIEQDIFRVHPQVGGIIPLSVTLGPLTPSEVRLLLEKRYAHLRNGFQFTPPVATADAEALYARYHGHLRDFLRLLSGAVQRHAVTAAGTSLSAEHVVRTMAATYATGLTSRITNEDARALATTLVGQPFDAEFRVTDIEQRSGATQALASRLVARLLERGVISESRRRGRSVFYRVRHGDDTVALGLV
jgi:hypothetical protein